MTAAGPSGPGAGPSGPGGGAGAGPGAGPSGPGGGAGAGPLAGTCLSCGLPLSGDHSRCVYDPPRFCSRCGRRLRVQVLPTGYQASCPVCDGPGRPPGAGPAV